MRFEDLEIESRVLGACFIDNRVVALTASKISKEDFSNSKHSKLFEILLNMFSEKIPIELTTVYSEIKVLGLQRSFTIEFVGNISTSCPSIVNIEYYIDRIKKLSSARRILNVSKMVSTDSKLGEMNVDDFIGEVQGRLSNALLSTVDDVSKPLSSGSVDVLKFAEKGSKDNIGMIKTGINVFDESFGGLYPGVMTLMAGRPGMGKTSFALNIALNSAKDGKKVFFISLEDGIRGATIKIMSMISGIPAWKIRQGEVPGDQMSFLYKASSDIDRLPINVYDRTSLTSRKLVNIVLAEKIRNGIDLLIIDHVHKLRTSGDQTQAMTDISLDLSALAQNENLVMLALAQLNRGVESRDDKHPLMSDLKQSGGFEQDARAIILLYRDEYYNKEKSEKKGIIDVDFAKNNFGKTGVCEIPWDASTGRLMNSQTFDPSNY